MSLYTERQCVHVSVPAGSLHDAARPSGVGPVGATALPLTAAGSVGLGTARGGTSRCAHCACWGSPLY